MKWIKDVSQCAQYYRRVLNASDAIAKTKRDEE